MNGLAVIPKHEPRSVDTLSRQSLRYTQGIVRCGRLLLESSGPRGCSAIAMIDPLTGRDVELRPATIDAHYEDITLAGDLAVIATWDGACWVHIDPSTLKTVSATICRESIWGITYDCHSGTFFTTNGSNRITVRDRELEPTGEVIEVTLADELVDPELGLSALDFDSERNLLFATVPHEAALLAISRCSGGALWTIDFEGFQPGPPNGLDHLSAVAVWESGALYVTGKNWPHLCRVAL